MHKNELSDELGFEIKVGGTLKKEECMLSWWMSHQLSSQTTGKWRRYIWVWKEKREGMGVHHRPLFLTFHIQINQSPTCFLNKDREGQTSEMAIIQVLSSLGSVPLSDHMPTATVRAIRFWTMTHFYSCEPSQWN